MGGCPQASLAYVTRDSTHNFSVRAGGSKAAQTKVLQ